MVVYNGRSATAEVVAAVTDAIGEAKAKAPVMAGFGAGQSLLPRPAQESGEDRGTGGCGVAAAIGVQFLRTISWNHLNTTPLTNIRRLGNCPSPTPHQADLASPQLLAPRVAGAYFRLSGVGDRADAAWRLG